LLAQMDRTGGIRTNLAIPTIAIAGNPTVDAARKGMNPGNAQHPGYKSPSRKRESDLFPGVDTRINAAVLIDCLHEAHGIHKVYLGEARGHNGVVKIQEFNSSVPIPAAQWSHAGAAHGALAIIKDGELGQLFSPLKILTHILRKGQQRGRNDFREKSSRKIVKSN
jgi:hypothetical protein